MLPIPIASLGHGAPQDAQPESVPLPYRLFQRQQLASIPADASVGDRSACDDGRHVAAAGSFNSNRLTSRPPLMVPRRWLILTFCLLLNITNKLKLDGRNIITQCQWCSLLADPGRQSANVPFTVLAWTILQICNQYPTMYEEIVRTRAQKQCKQSKFWKSAPCNFGFTP